MTILVGYPASRRARAIIDLASMLSRSAGESLTVCTAIRDPRVPGTRREDAKFRDYTDELVNTARANACEDVPDDIQAEFIRADAKSIASALIDAAQKNEASMIVVGSAMGRIEEVTVSSIADRLLHSSPVPVAVSTRGHQPMTDRVRRVTLAFASGEDTAVHVAAAEEFAARFGAELRLASFAVNLAPTEALRVNAGTNAGSLESWEHVIRAEVSKAIEYDAATAYRAPEIVVGHGRTWGEALDDVEWLPGDLLVVSSSESGPLSGVFLGSRATKIIRHTPVPVIALPRESAESLARQ